MYKLNIFNENEIELNDFKKDDFFENFNFELEDFQKKAIEEIRKNNNVIVIAPTSSGKTIIAKYCIFFNFIHRIKKKRVIYITPIKALSNEKYQEMIQFFNKYDLSVGLLTGDHDINKDADIIIMTAEILLLFIIKIQDNKNIYGISDDFLESISCVIIDEMHYINDPNRGNVWEKIIINLNNNIQIIGLSATVDSPEIFSKWLLIKNRDVSLIKIYNRPIPLEYYIFNKKLYSIKKNELFDYENFYKSIKDKSDKNDNHINDFIDFAVENDLLQVVFVVFSKNKCSNYAKKYKKNLLTIQESKDIENIFKKTINHTNPDCEKTYTYTEVLELLKRGIGYHHAGMQIVIKETIEILFKKGLIKVLFATETLAIGINMPIRTICFLSLEKHTDNEFRFLNSSEFRQFSGRAGRRGLDLKGNIVILNPTLDYINILPNLLNDFYPIFNSKMKYTYNDYLKTKILNNLDIEQIYDKSFEKFQIMYKINSIQKDIEIIKEEIKEITENKNDFFTKNNINKEYIYEEFKKQKYFNDSDLFFKINKKKSKKKSKQIEDKLKINAMEFLFSIYNKENIILEKIKDIKFYENGKKDIVLKMKYFLVSINYLNNEYKLNINSLIAINFNDCNPFILTEILMKDFFQNMDTKQIIILLSIFVNKKSKLIKSYSCETIQNVVIFIEEFINKTTNIEKKINIINDEDYWDYTLDYMEVTEIWINIKDDFNDLFKKLFEMNEELGIFVGNMLKINNIVNKLIFTCGIYKKEYLPKLINIQQYIIKSFVNYNSTYI